MFNKKGQTLILMVILIPIVIGIMALVVDVGYLSLEKIHMKEVTKTVIREDLEKNMDNKTLEEILKKNDIDIQNLKIKRSDNKLNIQNEVEIESIFGAIIGINEYKIKIDITGYKENEKIKFE